jgi:hypothetical protein
MAAEKLNKMKAVRDAVEALPKTATRNDVARWIKVNRGTDVQPDTISAYLTVIKRKKQVRARKAKAETVVSSPTATVQDVIAVGELTKRFGGEKVRRLVNLFG